MHEYLRHIRNGFSGEGKGQTAEVTIATRAWLLVCRRISVVLSHFVERYLGFTTKSLYDFV